MFALCIIDETYLNICSVGKSMEKTDLVGWYNNGIMFFNNNKKIKYSLYTRFLYTYETSHSGPSLKIRHCSIFSKIKKLSAKDLLMPAFCKITVLYFCCFRKY